MEAFFRPIDSRASAQSILSGTALLFYVLAAIQIIGGVIFLLLAQYPPVLGIVFLISGAIYAGLAYLLQSKQSRVAAVLLLAISILSFVNVLEGGVIALIIAVIVLVAAIRATGAAFYLHKHTAPDVPPDDRNRGEYSSVSGRRKSLSYN